MTLRAYPYPRPRKARTTYYVNLYENSLLKAKLSGFHSLEHARTEGQLIADAINARELTIEQVKEQHGKKFLGKTQMEWAEQLGIHRNAIYQGAKYQGISWQEWITNRIMESTNLADRKPRPASQH